MKVALRNATPRNDDRWIRYGAWVILSFLLFLRPITRLVHLALDNDDVSHILLIPFIAAGVLYVERQRVFRYVTYGLRPAAFLLILSVISVSWTLASGTKWNVTSNLTGFTLALVLFWIAGFAFLFGRNTLMAARFSMFLLLLTVPLPTVLMDRVIYLLQEGSAAVTGALFDLFGVPALREGLIFHLANVNIEVAAECSGIRSSMALFVFALLVTHFGLTAFWKKAFFMACGLFMMILKNGVRIATLTILAIYVEPGFLTGRLHRAGGVVFFLLGLLLLFPILLILRHGESSANAGKNQVVRATLR